MEPSEKSQKNLTKLYVGIFVGFMVILSFVVAWIMAGHLSKDVSKERFKLTKEYKKLKDYEYTYDAAKGLMLYQNFCSKCHGKNGMGTTYYPPLKNSNLVINYPQVTTKIIVKGLKGAINRNGRSYNAQMPGYKALGSIDLSHIYNYILKSINDKDLEVHPIEFNKAKIDTLTLEGAIEASELENLKAKK